ncbi:hypothetical protein [Mucilaginibacter sp. UYCu711]|uniref:hypothetical protein n=1 Tax=Mucilaginibacter sp. UYCu711 TaxID=3156339 RepID=UPI003D1FC828
MTITEEDALNMDIILKYLADKPGYGIGASEIDEQVIAGCTETLADQYLHILISWAPSLVYPIYSNDILQFVKENDHTKKFLKKGGMISFYKEENAKRRSAEADKKLSRENMTLVMETANLSVIIARKAEKQSRRAIWIAVLLILSIELIRWLWPLISHK